MAEPIKLEPSDIRAHWDDIRPGLCQIKDEWPDLSTWRVEDVYHEVLSGRAILYYTEDGFAVCALETDEYSGESDLFIWIAFSFGTAGMIPKYLPSFIEVAKHLGCKGVSTVSNHPALEKAPIERLYSKYRVKIDG